VFHSQKLITFAHVCHATVAIENPSFFDLKNVKIAFFCAQAPHRAGFCLFLRSKNKQKKRGRPQSPAFWRFFVKMVRQGAENKSPAQRGIHSPAPVEGAQKRGIAALR